MTTLSPAQAAGIETPAPASPTAKATPSEPGKLAALPARAAAILMPLGAVLMTASVPIDPTPTDAPEPRGTIEAYTADPQSMDIAATILHNGFLLLGIGLLLAGFAVGGRGRWLAIIGGLAGGIGFMNLSGAVLIDWFHAASGQVVGVDAAVKIDQRAMLPVVTAGWFIPMALGAALGPILLMVGLVRAKVAPVWIFALPALLVALIFSGVMEGPGFVASFALVAVIALALGVALWRATRAEAGRA